MKNDIFANIAAAGIGGRQELLSRPEPVPFEPNNAVLTAGGEAYGVSEKMHTGFGDECMSLIKMDKSIKRRKK